MVNNIYQQIDQWGVTDPQRIAYQGEETYTYGQLKAYSDAMAAYLKTQEITEGPVVVFGDLEFEMLATFIGASKAGHAYIPIEANTPEDRIALILSVAQPVMILAVEPWPDLATACPVVTPTALAEILHQENQLETSLTGVVGDDTYYIIFTSGTTGVPKGVQISHKNLLSFVEWELSAFGIKEGMSFLDQAPYSFDLSVMSIYPALCSGGSLVPMKKAVIEDFKTLFATLPTLDLEVWVSTPSFMDICLMEPTFDAQHVPSLEIFLFCGEEMPRHTAEKLLERFPKAQIYNTYGPTETTVAISGVAITPAIMASYDRLPIGYVKADTTVTIMDGEQILPAGEVGEIVISGPSVSKGYLRNPEKTAQAFFTLNGQPAYRTGDAGKLAADGMLLYDGRIDFQVKLHGFRIELEDIDHHLDQVSYVKQATVVPKYQNHKVQQLVAFVVVANNPFDKEFKLTKAIKEELSQGVMDYMIPQKFVYVDQLPLTANGKIDRKGLINEVNNG